MADNPGQIVPKNCGEAEAKTTAELLDRSNLEAAYKLFAECWTGDEQSFQKYAMTTNALERNGVGNDFSFVVNDRFSRTGQSVRSIYMDSFKFE